MQDVSLDLKAGISAILGRNGAGKTTLVKLLVGVEEPTSGEVVIKSQHIQSVRDQLRRTGWLPQDFGFPPNMRVANFVEYAAWLKEVPSAHLLDRVSEALEISDVHDVRTQKLGQLSGGTLRRVGLAASLVHRPSFLVLDEPTSGLDPEQRSMFHERLAVIESTTIVLSTHLLEDVEALADSIHILDHGGLIWSGNLEALGGQGSPSEISGSGALRRGFLSIVQGTSS